MQQAQSIIENWFESKEWSPFDWQREVWHAFIERKSGLLNAPTGSGKTFALFMPTLMSWIEAHPDNYQSKEKNGLQLLWVTPLRALARNLEEIMQEVVDDLGIPWSIQRRTGDVSSSIKQKQKTQMPEVLIITPESLHVLLAQKGYPKRFKSLKSVVVDEWHELLGSKRGTQTELGLSRLRGMNKDLQTWGISATIGNFDEAFDVLLGIPSPDDAVIIKANVQKNIDVKTVLPDDVEKFPWSGHLGTNLLHKVLPILDKSGSTLIFTNVRSQCEIWFQKLLEANPNLAGEIGIHHGSLDRNVRNYIEQALHSGDLKTVVCTSSLDLGVDFTPVDTVIQVGSPKGVARFIQRAGRSGHQPNSISTIWFVPTHALELIEAAALKEAVQDEKVESRDPILKPIDVLVQYLVTLAVSEGFVPDQIYKEVRQTFAFQTLREEEWDWILNFIQYGGKSLSRYDEFSKVEPDENGLMKVFDRRISRRHRMSIGTIESASMMRVKYMKGSTLGRIEEWFISQLNVGDAFWFAGRNLELVRVKDLTAYVRKTKGASSKVPAWLGGRMSLSSNMSDLLRKKLQDAVNNTHDSIDLRTIEPIFDIQRKRSILPGNDQFLIEKSYSKEGCHCFFFPFEGRYVHEGMSALVAHRISKLMPITFSIAMNDYGFELLSDQDIPIEEALKHDLFSEKNLVRDIRGSLNSTELAKRRFRGISQIAGLVFPGYPGNQKKSRHLQMSSGLFFDVFSEHEPDNLLLQQAHDEVLQYQLDEARLRQALQRIHKQEVVLKHVDRFSPFAFPIFVDRLREKLSSEKLIDRVKKMQKQLEED
ncbi:ligase-associated DNA damage response DEXH box helicase [Rhodohalobacter sulfatireducens]|uniref:Ligase-associated DNA damage response DEXH box helicase n=1 Tax=Rhodohalobacter sulfatireducens TaxID=2911366 RepID=A0ABS9K9A4_9BACT|nr:ligase-associated DNA damage response DEXH box helicase [Rhodohalobacter sulfatireducens]MCG2587439.1 ligase-associated DNA damage response DEXH box helicase [Rhodohalobacter sulfatireducens]